MADNKRANEKEPAEGVRKKFHIGAPIDPQRLEEEKRTLEELNRKPFFKRISGFSKLTGPGFLQSAVTLGAGSAGGCLIAGSTFGYRLIWVQPLAMILGMFMFFAIAKQAVAVRRRPYEAMKNELHFAFAFLFGLSALLASVIWHFPQYSLAGDVANDLAGLVTGATDPIPVWILGAVFLGFAIFVTWNYGKGIKGIRIYEKMLKMLVWLIVVAFALVVLRTGVNWKEFFSGFVPRLPRLPDGSFDHEQANLMIALLGAAVGVNMVFLYPYSLMARGWGKQHRLAYFDLLSAMFIPFILATGLVVVGTSNTLHKRGVVESGNSDGDKSVVVNVGTVTGNSNVTVNFDAIVSTELPPDVKEVSCRAEVACKEEAKGKPPRVLERKDVLITVLWSQGSRVSGLGSGVWGQGSGVRDQESGIRDQGSGIRAVAGDPTPDTRHPTPEPPNPLPTPGSPTPDTRNPKPAPRSRLPETRYPKPQTPSPLVVESRHALLTDRDKDGVPGPGDTLRYEVKIANSGHTSLLSVVFKGIPDRNTHLVPQSVQSRTITRSAVEAARVLAPVVGLTFGRLIFGVGMLAIALSTITVHMLMCAFIISEMFGIDPTGWRYRLLVLTPAIGVFGVAWKLPFGVAVFASSTCVIFLPMAYICFMVLHNKRRFMGEAMPRGGKRILWNAGMALAIAVVSIFAIVKLSMMYRDVKKRLFEPKSKVAARVEQTRQCCSGGSGLGSGVWGLGSGIRGLGSGVWDQGTWVRALAGDPKPDPRHPIPDTRNPIPEARSPKPETHPPKSTVGEGPHFK